MVKAEGPQPETGMPRWVKTLLVIGGGLAVLIVVALLSGHGPGRHMSQPAVTAAAVSGT
ncbi:hypothetical protein Aca07nite_71200 [Actinoplanes capillaceus]|uniref:Uncharacterized protein n=1 Tax=Actinoplanes campanulatus TaxID=113559 RepID=A0ABQ3WUK6_9ACTN|nr:hypothetical protein [Actinoplanes capillaceus]GID49845.1 hypothetical protein Aca07nite_71200 [Actinoplanes capillaceus]